MALGTGKTTSANLVRDDEFDDRYFLTIESKREMDARFTLAGDDLTHLLDALCQAKDELP